MYYFQLLIIITQLQSLFTHSSTTKEDETVDLLKKIRENIDKNDSVQCISGGDFDTSAGLIFKNKFWKPFTGEIPVLVLCLTYNVDTLGNGLGAYFHSLSCSVLTRGHFLGVKRSFISHNPNIHDSFWDAIPDLLVHPNPVNYETVMKNMDIYCKCDRFCWHQGDPWSQNLPMISNILQRGFELHLGMKSSNGKTPEQRGMHVDSSRDISNAKPGERLPLFPDVAIHYRCSDNIFGGMGLLPFGTIISRIPKETRTIYVFTEYGARLAGRVFETAAPHILRGLYDDLRAHFPQATVVIKRGGNEITIWAQFAYANMTYCSPSTYCFWPALARNGTTYMPATSYLASSESGGEHQYIGPNFNWVKNQALYNDFTKDTPAEDILRKLRSDLPPVPALLGTDTSNAGGFTSKHSNGNDYPGWPAGTMSLGGTVSGTGAEVEATLRKIQTEIDSNATIHFQAAGDQATPASLIYRHGFWRPWTKDIPVQVLCMQFHTGAIGNFLGTYFDSVACAADSGTHFMGVKKEFGTTDPKLQDKFWDGLPDLLIHPHPVAYNKSLENVANVCKCDRFCWNNGDPWGRNIPMIRSIVERSLQLHLEMKSSHGKTPEQRGMHVDSSRDISNAKPGERLPLFPDVAIHYRCSDNIFGGMGLLPFGTIISRIPKEARTIYVFTEYGARLAGRVFETAAPHILRGLYDDLRAHFPQATVVIKRGGNEITIWAQFAYANMTYCSPSTYCFWPALARNGTTYMPATTYIACTPGGSSHTEIGPNYHWIENQALYNDFTKDTPAEDILRKLRSDLPPVPALLGTDTSNAGGFTSKHSNDNDYPGWPAGTMSLGGTVSGTGAEVEATLRKIQTEIDSNTTIHFQAAGDQATPASLIYRHGFWRPWTKDIPVQVLCMRFHVDAIGNFLGTYFDSVACAADSGTHFMGVKKEFGTTDPKLQDKFWDGLPDLLIHPHPVAYNKSLENVANVCKCDRFCWNNGDPWGRNIPMIRSIVERSLQLHLGMKSSHGKTPEQRGMHVDSSRDISNAKPGERLPLFPDVAIHYRCSDNIFGGMGLLPFGTIISRIPKEARTIYVFTEYGARLAGRVFETAAPHILRGLYDDLRAHFPQATVVIKRGGNEITIWAQFAYANMTYCSPSTYCFWPALARNGTTYMPATSYIACTPGGSSHTEIGPNYHWIENQALYNDFTKDTPAEDILRKLRSDLPPVPALPVV